MKKFLMTIIILVTSVLATGSEESIGSIPMTPLIPAAPVEKPEEEGKVRHLLKVGAVIAKIEGEVVVPLEVISDIDIKALVVDDENLEIPFELELSRKPEGDSMYRIDFSSTQIDIDNDGIVDTEIFVNDRISDRIIRDNHVKITGKNISREGTHNKRVYITVKVRE